MEPTLQPKDIAVFCDFSYLVAPVERGDIIEFYSREYDMDMSKRVIGIAGDHIEFHDGYVFINNMQCVESYIPDEMGTYCDKKFDVPDGTVFVMGDNRWDSIDSREFENPYIPMDDIYGKFFGLLRNPFSSKDHLPVPKYDTTDSSGLPDSLENRNDIAYSLSK